MSDRNIKMRYFEDIEINKRDKLGEYVVDKQEVIEFARKWDPQVFHIDEEAAKSYPYGGIIAPSGYIVSVITLVAAESDLRMATLGLLGYEEMRFPNPARPGDTLTLVSECTEKRESQSNSSRGIVHTIVELINQKGEIVFTSKSSFMVARRPH